MDKPSDYGSDIRGSNPLRGTRLFFDWFERFLLCVFPKFNIYKFF